MQVISTNVLLEMLRTALLEIRAADDLEMAKRLAGVFHVLPSQLISGKLSDDKAEAIYDSLILNAKRYGLEGYVIKLRQSCSD